MDAEPRDPDGGAAPAATSAVDRRLDDPRVQAVALAVGVVAVSAAAILVRVADAPALALAFWRTALGAAALAYSARRSRVVPRGRTRWLLVASGVLLAAHFTLWFVSLDLTTVAASAVLVSMSPVAVAFGSWLFLGEPPQGWTWIGLCLAVAGAAVIAAADLDGAVGAHALAGDALALAAAVAAAGYLLLGRHARRTLPVSVYATWTYGTAAVVLLVAGLVTGVDFGLGGYDRTTWLAIAGLVIGPQLLGHTVFNLVMARVPATVVSVMIVAEPVGATVLAALLLRETPSGLFYAGAPLVLAGVLLAARGPRPRAAPQA